MSLRKITHDIIYWCEYTLVVQIISYPDSNTPPVAVVVYGGGEDTTEEECQAYIDGADAWMHEGLSYE